MHHSTLWGSNIPVEEEEDILTGVGFNYVACGVC